MSSHKCVVFSGYQPLKWTKSMSGQLSFAIPLTEPRPPQYVRGPWFFATVNQWVETQKFTTFSVDGPAKSPPNGWFWNPNKNMGCWPLFVYHLSTHLGWLKPYMNHAMFIPLLTTVFNWWFGAGPSTVSQHAELFASVYRTGSFFRAQRHPSRGDQRGQWSLGRSKVRSLVARWPPVAAPTVAATVGQQVFHGRWSFLGFSWMMYVLYVDLGACCACYSETR